MAKKKEETPFIGCTLRRLPETEWENAARIAISENPANQPPSAALMTMSEEPTKTRIAALTSKWWKAGSVKLGVAFMDGGTAELQDRILSHMNAWGERANVKFARASLGMAQVRIARVRGDGYWSYLGTDIMSIPVGQPTMNLDSFSMSTPESEYLRVVRHETGHCLDGDTLIDCPRDLNKHPLGIPIKELVGQQPWVYCWKDGKITVRQASRVWKSKEGVPTVRVKLAPGRGYVSKDYLPPLELVGTPDHPVLLADGKTWKNLGDLQRGDRLCSMYRSKNDERSRIRWTGGEREREHVIVCQEAHGPRPLGHHAHHKNENKMDQSVDNLEWKLEFDHHSDHSKGRPASPRTVAATIERNKTRVWTAESRAKASKSAKVRWQRHADNHTVLSVEKAWPRDVYDMTVPDADNFVANGVVVHNSLGFPHEHMRKAIIEKLDQAKTVAFFLRTYGWSRGETVQQVLTPLSEADLFHPTPTDETSIMAYQLPGSITRDGKPIVGGLDINVTDAGYAAQLYPLSSTPPPPSGDGGITLILPVDYKAGTYTLTLRG